MSWWLRFYPPGQGNPNINRRVLQMEMRTESIFEAWIFAQQFYKLTHPDRNNILTCISDFLQLRHCFFIPSQQCFFSVANWVVSIGHTRTPMPKHPRYSKTSFLSEQYTPTFMFDTPVKCTCLPLRV